MHEITLLSRPKLNLMGTHYGVCLGNGHVLDFQPAGTRIITMNEFAGDFQVKKGCSRHMSTFELQGVIARLSELKYDLIGNNCEHIARFVVENKKESKQIGLLGLILVGVFIYIASK